jgi:hypothetical protein
VQLDPRTGAQLARARSNGWPIGEGQRFFWVATAAPGPEPYPVLMDLHTGEIVFPQWQLAGATEDLNATLMTRTFSDSMEFAVFDGTTGRLAPLGRVRGRYDNCGIERGYLLCVDDHVVLHVWRAGA